MNDDLEEYILSRRLEMPFVASDQLALAFINTETTNLVEKNEFPVNETRPFASTLFSDHTWSRGALPCFNLALIDPPRPVSANLFDPLIDRPLLQGPIFSPRSVLDLEFVPARRMMPRCEDPSARFVVQAEGLGQILENNVLSTLPRVGHGGYELPAHIFVEHERIWRTRIVVVVHKWARRKAYEFQQHLLASRPVYTADSFGHFFDHVVQAFLDHIINPVIAHVVSQVETRRDADWSPLGSCYRDFPMFLEEYRYFSSLGVGNLEKFAREPSFTFYRNILESSFDYYLRDNALISVQDFETLLIADFDRIRLGTTGGTTRVAAMARLVVSQPPRVDFDKIQQRLAVSSQVIQQAMINHYNRISEFVAYRYFFIKRPMAFGSINASYKLVRGHDEDHLLVRKRRRVDGFAYSPHANGLVHVVLTNLEFLCNFIDFKIHHLQIDFVWHCLWNGSATVLLVKNQVTLRTLTNSVAFDLERAGYGCIKAHFSIKRIGLDGSAPTLIYEDDTAAATYLPL